MRKIEGCYDWISICTSRVQVLSSYFVIIASALMHHAILLNNRPQTIWQSHKCHTIHQGTVHAHYSEQKKRSRKLITYTNQSKPHMSCCPDRRRPAKQPAVIYRGIIRLLF